MQHRYKIKLCNLKAYFMLILWFLMLNHNFKDLKIIYFEIILCIHRTVKHLANNSTVTNRSKTRPQLQTFSCEMLCFLFKIASIYMYYNYKLSSLLEMEKQIKNTALGCNDQVQCKTWSKNEGRKKSGNRISAWMRKQQ